MAPHPMKITLAALLSASVLAGCGKKEAPEATPAAAAPASAATASPAAVPPATPASTAVPAASAPAPASAPAASTDPDAPTPLAGRELKGSGVQKSVSYYYALRGGPGTVKITATAKNRPSGATNALTVGLYDTQANRLCYDQAGNTNSDKTFTVSCSLDKAQPLVLRLDLSEETIDYSVSLDGPVELAAPGTTAATASVAGAGSTDIDEPTRLNTHRIKAAGTDQPTSYYYTFNAGPGELTLTIDGKNKPAAATEALRVSLLTLRSERVCEVALGNTTLDKRAVQACRFDKREPVILRVDTSAETIDWRVRFDGPHDFEPYTPPKQVTIALDAAALFDTGRAVLKPEARATLKEAAERIMKFKDAPVLVAGHTDNVGSDASNQALSEKRAQAVRDHLVQEGVPATRLTAKGFGKTQPVADNTTEAGRARNRRVDVVISARQ